MKKILFTLACCVLIVILVQVSIRSVSVLNKKMYRVGIPKPSVSLAVALEGFKKEMSEHGYKEGKNISYTIIEEGKNGAESREHLAQFVRTKPDLIYALGINAARDAKEITAENAPDVPVLFAVVSDPVGNKLVSTIRSSGNNVTGIAGGNDIIAAKRVELFLELVPTTKRIIFIWNNALTTGIEHVRKMLLSTDVVLFEKQVQNEADIDAYLSEYVPIPGDALFRAPDSVLGRRVKELSVYARAHSIALVGTNHEDVVLGALMSYGADFEKVGVQAAQVAAQILRGTAPTDLPIIYPERYELVLNRQMAEKLGLTFSASALANVDKYVP